MQRVYTGNVPTGEHQLEVSVIGKLAGGRDYNADRTLQYQQGRRPKLVGITLAGPDSGKAAIEIGELVMSRRASALTRSCPGGVVGRRLG